MTHYDEKTKRQNRRIKGFFVFGKSRGMYRRVSPFGRRPNDTVLVYAQLPFLSSQTAKRASEAGRVEHTIPVPFLPNSGRGGFCLRKGVEIGTLSVLYYKQTKERLGFMRYTSAEANKLLKKLKQNIKNVKMILNKKG